MNTDSHGVDESRNTQKSAVEGEKPAAVCCNVLDWRRGRAVQCMWAKGTGGREGHAVPLIDILLIARIFNFSMLTARSLPGI